MRPFTEPLPWSDNFSTKLLDDPHPCNASVNGDVASLGDDDDLCSDGNPYEELESLHGMTGKANPCSSVKCTGT